MNDTSSSRKSLRRVRNLIASRDLDQAAWLSVRRKLLRATKNIDTGPAIIDLVTAVINELTLAKIVGGDTRSYFERLELLLDEIEQAQDDPQAGQI